MRKNVIDLETARIDRKSEVDAEMIDFFLNQPPTITPQQCVQGREILGWSEEALAFRSGASVKAIQQFEKGSRPLKWVTKQALQFAMEEESLIFIPGYAPSVGNNCRGSTQDPRSRDDFHLIE
jgi:DNA-binding transcriptional regulator YiaG